jgi:RTX calcium-binding nonapeptide repeat (4 copies)
MHKRQVPRVSHRGETPWQASPAPRAATGCSARRAATASSASAANEIIADLIPSDDRGGGDEVDAGPGDDRVHAFGGDNVIYGSLGRDILVTAKGDDFIDAGPEGPGSRSLGTFGRLTVG